MRWLILSWLVWLAACQRAPAHHAAVDAAVVVAPTFCTRTLGLAQCFADPGALPDRPMGLADGRTTLTPEQEKNAAASRWWPF